MLRLGYRAHNLGKLPLEKLALSLGQHRIGSIQLALAKALSDLPPDEVAFTPGYAREVRRALEARGVRIAVLGCYINPVHPDEESREKALRRFESHIGLAEDFGCGIVATETGSLNPDCSYNPGTASPKTFDTLCSSIERLLRAAERTGRVMVGVEAVASRHTIDTIDKMAALLRRLDSPRLGVVYDPVNLIPETGVGDQAAFFREALDAFGPRIIAVHLKDFRIVDGHKRGELPALSGELDTEALLGLLQSTGSDLDVLLENCGGDEVDATMTKLSRYLSIANDTVMPREGNGHCC